jgi:hypothetical protein
MGIQDYRTLVAPTGGAAQTAASLFAQTPLWLTPERYKTDTQAIYADAGDSANYSGATNWAPYFDAMRQEILSLAQQVEWGYSPEYRLRCGIAFQPGKRYRVNAPINWTALPARGFQVHGNGAWIVSGFSGAGALLDLIGTLGWTIDGLNTESDSNLAPWFHRLIGRKTSTNQAPNMHFTNCCAIGWASKALHYNMGSESSAIVGGVHENDYADGVAIQIDNVNELDVAGATVATGVSLGTAGTPSAPISCIDHYLGQTEARSIGGSTKGAIRIVGTNDANLNRVRGVKIDRVYLTNNGADTNNHPGIYIKGKVDDLDVLANAELNVNNATIQLSHLGYYDTTDGPVTQFSHRFREFFDMGEVGVLGKSADANVLTLVAAEIEIGYKQGQNQSGVAAKLFDANMSSAVICGTAKLGQNSNLLLNFDALGGWQGDIFAEAAFSNLTLPSGSNKSSGRFITPTKTTYFPSGPYTPTLTAEVNLDSVALVGGAQWDYRVIGSRLQVWGLVSVDPTSAAATLTTFGATLPTGVVSDFTLITHLQGEAVSPAGSVAVIWADVTNDRAQFRFNSAITAATNFSFHFDAEIR